jgi:hypothetical protein
MAVAKAEHRMDTAYHNRMLAEVNLRHAQATRTRVAQATSALEHARLMDRVARDVYHARRGRRVSYDEVKHPRNPYGLFVAKGVARRAR